MMETVDVSHALCENSCVKVPVVHLGVNTSRLFQGGRLTLPKPEKEWIRMDQH